MNEQFESSPGEAAQSAISLGISAFNGIFALAAALARNGLLSKSDLEYLHSNMLNPLNNDGSSTEMMALQTKRIDDLCAALATVVRDQEE